MGAGYLLPVGVSVHICPMTDPYALSKREECLFVICIVLVNEEEALVWDSSQRISFVMRRPHKL